MTHNFTTKKADLDNALTGAIGGAGIGVPVGAGVGGVYGLLSGAYQNPRGAKLRGALRGLVRGLGGGALVGGGIGAGAGAGMLGGLPANVTSDDHAGEAAQNEVNRDPLRYAARVLGLGTLGAAGGGLFGSELKHHLIGEPKKEHTEDKKDEKAASAFDNPSFYQFLAGAGGLAHRGIAEYDHNKKKEEKEAGAKPQELKRVPVSKLEARAFAEKMKSDPYGLKKEKKAASAFEFGSKVALELPKLDLNSPLAQGGLGGAALGAGLGGLAGLMNPGEDEHGKRKSRLMAALKGVLGGGVSGGAAGAAAGHFAPEMVKNVAGRAQGLYGLGKHTYEELMGRAPSYNAASVSPQQMAAASGMV